MTGPMSNLRMPVALTSALLLATIAALALCQTESGDVRRKVELALDSWTDRASAHESVEKLGQRGFVAVASIAENSKEPSLRRRLAISLLATFNTQESVDSLIKILNDERAVFRCLAIHSLIEIKKRRAVPALIRKLDDQTVCLKSVQTHTKEQIDVYVSDEAVRALEGITGVSFEEEKDLWIIGHRSTQPWREWWAKNSVLFVDEN